MLFLYHWGVPNPLLSYNKKAQADVSCNDSNNLTTSLPYIRIFVLRKIVQPFSQPFIIVDSQRQNGWRVLLSNPSGWFSRDFPFRVFLITLISCKQVQALVRLLAELSCLAQTLFCLSLGPCEETVCLHPALLRLKSGWTFLKGLKTKSFSHFPSEYQQ